MTMQTVHRLHLSDQRQLIVTINIVHSQSKHIVIRQLVSFMRAKKLAQAVDEFAMQTEGLCKSM